MKSSELNQCRQQKAQENGLLLLKWAGMGAFLLVALSAPDSRWNV